MFTVNNSKCIGCMQCITDCPANDIFLNDNKKVTIKNENCLSCGHCIAICPKDAVTTDTYSMDQVKPYNQSTFSIEPERLMNFIEFRRSTRQFKDEPVSKTLLNHIIEAGRFTQTSTNSQDVSYVVLSDTLRDVSDMIYDVLKQKGEYILANTSPETPAATQRYAQLWLKMYDAYHADKKKYDRLFFNAPSVILVTSNNPTNGVLASTNMELMTSALGLGSFFCGFALFAINDRPDLLEKIGVAPGKTIASCLVIGHPKVTYKRTVPRKTAEISWR